MIDSILTSVKKLCGGIAESDTTFDNELILHINTVLGGLTQIGVGPVTGFSITDASDTWDDFLGDATNLEMVKSYVGLKVHMIFDPPDRSAVLESMKEMIKEYEWRISVTVDPGEEEESNVDVP